MVRVRVVLVVDEIKSIEVSGHAKQAPKGEDLVCAGVSSISVGVLNALYKNYSEYCDLQMSEGYIGIQVKDSHAAVQIILSTMLMQLQTVEESYPQYIQIKQEVSS